jgi:hypothetical protein
MPQAGFETAIPDGQRPQTHALDRAGTGIGFYIVRLGKYKKKPGGRQVVLKFNGAGTSDSVLF